MPVQPLFGQSGFYPSFLPDDHAGMIPVTDVLVSHKSAKETISCQESSNVVIAIYVFEAIQYRIMAKRHFFYCFTLGEVAKDH